jgi:hypothetical protein
MIKWILFDQAGVQTYEVFTRKEVYSVNGKQFSGKELESIFNIPEYRQFSVGNIDERNLISTFLKKKNLRLSVSEYIELFKKGIEPVEGMENL